MTPAVNANSQSTRSTLRVATCIALIWAALISGWALATANAQVADPILCHFPATGWSVEGGAAMADAAAEVRAERIAALADLLREVKLGERIEFGPDFTSDLLDPVVDLRNIKAKRQQTKTPDYALFRRSPLKPLYEAADRGEQRIYESTNINVGAAFNTLAQGLTESLPGEDTYGMVTAMSLIATWDGFNKGASNRGEITCGLEGRWDYSTTGPTELGFLGLGSLGFTANPFAAYTPTFLVRNLFWRQGSREAGWLYRLGKVTPDSMLATSTHINPLGTFLPIVGTGGFTMALPDSGLGLIGGFFINDRLNVMGVFRMPMRTALPLVIPVQVITSKRSSCRSRSLPSARMRATRRSPSGTTTARKTEHRLTAAPA